MANISMMFPNTVEEFMEEYKMVDTEHIYSNGIEYVPIFRMEQWFAHQADIPRWIPVTDRLPEKYGQYLVTFIPSGGTLWTKVLIARYSDLMGIAKPSFHIGEVGENSFVNINEQVIAWMPLPEPYKGGEQNG